LAVLTLIDNTLRDDGARALVDAPNKSTSLNELHLDYNSNGATTARARARRRAQG